MIQTASAARDVPREIADRLAAWVRRRRHAIFVHYFVGVLGILSSVAAAADAYSRWASLWMVVSSFCMGFMAFGNPRKEYGKFARAVRVLEAAILRYRYHDPDVEALLAAAERGEAIIEHYENDDGPSLRQVRDGLA
ncbi:hypothetical protein [Longimicrobium sp.]|uniref:hypothetical protein n=1 Tax=Longimicrobium sp. TaxID=2029185 RepID=UPI002E31FBFE|nr:hypothetical protein [Longimicrobium sp.]